MRYFKFIPVLVLIIGIAANRAMAQGDSGMHQDAVTSATPQLAADEVVITGKVICLGCHLEKEKQAKAQCSIYGHTNAIIIEKAINPEGKHLAGAEGEIYQFLHNEKSDELIKEHSYVGKVIIVVGRVYPEANIVEVNFFKERGVK